MATQLGSAIQDLLGNKPKQSWLIRAYKKIVSSIQNVFQRTKLDKGLIHNFPQKKVYTDGETYISSSEPNSKSGNHRGPYFPTQFPHTEWEAKEKNSSSRKDEEQICSD